VGAAFKHRASARLSDEKRRYNVAAWYFTNAVHWYCCIGGWFHKRRLQDTCKYLFNEYAEEFARKSAKYPNSEVALWRQASLLMAHWGLSYVSRFDNQQGKQMSLSLTTKTLLIHPAVCSDALVVRKATRTQLIISKLIISYVELWQSVWYFASRPCSRYAPLSAVDHECCPSSLTRYIDSPINHI